MNKLKFLPFLFVLLLLMSIAPAFASNPNWVKYAQAPASGFWDYDSISHWRMDNWGYYDHYIYWKDTSSFGSPYGLGSWEFQFMLWGTKAMGDTCQQEVTAYIKGIQGNGYPTNGNGIKAIAQLKSQTPTMQTWDFWLKLIINGVESGNLVYIPNKQMEIGSSWYVSAEIYYYNDYTAKCDWDIVCYFDDWSGSTTFGYVTYPDLYFKLFMPNPEGFQGFMEGASAHDITTKYFGGGGCPTAFIKDGDSFINLGTMQVHCEDGFVFDTVTYEKNMETKKVIMKLQEPNPGGTDIDYARLKAYSGDQFYLFDLESAVHSALGEIGDILASEDGETIFLGPTEEIILTFKYTDKISFDQLAFSLVAQNPEKIPL